MRHEALSPSTQTFPGIDFASSTLRCSGCRSSGCTGSLLEPLHQLPCYLCRSAYPSVRASSSSALLAPSPLTCRISRPQEKTFQSGASSSPELWGVALFLFVERILPSFEGGRWIVALVLLLRCRSSCFLFSFCWLSVFAVGGRRLRVLTCLGSYARCGRSVHAAGRVYLLHL